MKVQILGKHTRPYTNTNTGEITHYTDLYYQRNFLENEVKAGAIGYKTDKINTSLDCSKIGVGDLVNFDYGPTGYKNKDGSDQIRLQSIDIIEKNK
ncbi:MAG: hypothetical protein J6K37_07615 [Lachnospiraceae bacterium]|nr:hypothetical protein [Lachnospiraceae bacterium]